MIYTGKGAQLDCQGCGAPLRPPFALQEQDGKLFAGCPQLGCGARTRVVRRTVDAPGDTLAAWAPSDP